MLVVFSCNFFTISIDSDSTSGNQINSHSWIDNNSANPGDNDISNILQNGFHNHDHVTTFDISIGLFRYSATAMTTTATAAATPITTTSTSSTTYKESNKAEKEKEGETSTTPTASTTRSSLKKDGVEEADSLKETKSVFASAFGVEAGDNSNQRRRLTGVIQKTQKKRQQQPQCMLYDDDFLLLDNGFLDGMHIASQCMALIGPILGVFGFVFSVFGAFCKTRRTAIWSAQLSWFLAFVLQALVFVLFREKQFW